MTATPGFQPAPQGGGVVKALIDAANKDWVRRVSEVVNRILSGKINAVLQITLAASAGTTTVKDARIGPFSALILVPLTTHAAAALYVSPYVLPSNQQNGQVTLNHVNDANADKNFNLIIIG